MGSIADQVTLREITAETVRAVMKLSVTEYQTRFVAPNAWSLGQALFEMDEDEVVMELPLVQVPSNPTP
jgi:hypothetical protein